MPTRNNFAYNDYDREPSSFGFESVDVTAANFDAEAAKRAAVGLAAAAITLGEPRSSGYSFGSSTDKTPSSNPEAQREKKWLVTMNDQSVNKTFRFEVPTADLSILENNDSYIVRYGNVTITNATNAANVQSFIDAVEALYKSPYGNSAVVENIQFVGRNN